MIDYMDITTSTKIAMLHDLKYYPYVVKVTNDVNWNIFLPSSKDDLTRFVDYLREFIIDVDDTDTKNKEFLVCNINYTEWQGKKWVYAIEIKETESTISKVIFKSYSEIRSLYNSYSEDQQIKHLLPSFPMKKYIK